MLLASGAIGIFVATNVDSLVLLVMLFALPRTRWQTVVAGFCVGLGLLVAISAVAAAGLMVVPRPRAGLLGVIPILLGLRMLVRSNQAPDAGPRVGTGGVVALVLASGADNVAVYAPAFRTLGTANSLRYIAVFAVLAALWSALALWLARRKPLAQVVARWSNFLIPIMFIGVGAALIATTAG